MVTEWVPLAVTGEVLVSRHRLRLPGSTRTESPGFTGATASEQFVRGPLPASPLCPELLDGTTAGRLVWAGWESGATPNVRPATPSASDAWVIANSLRTVSVLVKVSVPEGTTGKG